MRTHGLRERSIIHWEQLVGVGERQWGVGREGKVGRDNMGRNARYSMYTN